MKTLWLLIFGVVFLWSAIAPKDYFTWILEVAPAVIGLGVLCCTYRFFRLTTLVYWMVLMHCIILMIGGHYTYAEVPLFDHLKEMFGWSRNNYDKVGHFFQGFVPALVAREIFIRKAVVKPGAWLHFLTVCCCLAISAFYELIEWSVAMLSDEAAESFLGTQGYSWDTQSDMAYALVGAILAIALFSRYHDRQIQKLASKLGIQNRD